MSTPPWHLKAGMDSWKMKWHRGHKEPGLWDVSLDTRYEYESYAYCFVKNGFMQGVPVARKSIPAVVRRNLNLGVASWHVLAK